MTSCLDSMPRAELHLHLEGCIGPELLLQLSERHNFPQGLKTIEDCRRVYSFHDFTGFIQAIKTASQHLLEPADYAVVVDRIMAEAARQHIVWLEVFLSIGILHWKQMEVEPVWRAVEAARLEGTRRHGVELVWIFDGVRQFGAAAMERVVDEALERQPSGSVAGIGIGGDEAAGPAEWFQECFHRARAGGLHLTAHAGESCGAEALWSALRTLRPERVGHGLSAVEDPLLMAELRGSSTWLDICPSSNLRTGVLALAELRKGESPRAEEQLLERHPLPKLLRQAVPVSLSSDDPGIFGTSLLTEYDICRTTLGLSAAEELRLIRNSFVASFMPAEKKQFWLAELDRLTKEAGF